MNCRLANRLSQDLKSFARGGEPPPPRRGIARLCLARGERGKKVAAVEEISNELPFS